MNTTTAAQIMSKSPIMARTPLSWPKMATLGAIALRAPVMIELVRAIEAMIPVLVAKRICSHLSLYSRLLQEAMLSRVVIVRLSEFID